MILIIFLILISAFAKSQQDKLTFYENGKLFNSDWWLNSDSDWNFWIKIPFSFLQNGWHLCDAVRTFSLMLVIALLIGAWWISIILYILYGIVFEVSYKYL